MAVDLVPVPEALIATAVPDSPLDASPAATGRRTLGGGTDRTAGSRRRLVVLGLRDERTRIHRSVRALSTVRGTLADHSLTAQLALAPLAVTGRTVTSDGCAVLGVRASWTMQEPGHLEFVPSGGVDEQARVGADQVDPRLTVYEELLEELGVDRTFVIDLVPRILAIDDAAHVHDLVFDIGLDLTAAEIGGRHRASRVMEHDHLQFVPLGDLEDCLATSTIGAVTARFATLPLRTMEAP